MFCNKVRGVFDKFCNKVRGVFFFADYKCNHGACFLMTKVMCNHAH